MTALQQIRVLQIHLLQIHVLKIQSMFYKSNPVDVLQYAFGEAQVTSSGIAVGSGNFPKDRPMNGVVVVLFL